MSALRWFALGMVSTMCAVAGAAFAYTQQARGFSARDQPAAFERWIAQAVRRMATPSDAKSQANPVPNSPEVLSDARAHWADHCATCHANNGSGEIEMGRHMYPPPPDMRQSGTQRLSDGELFYIIKNGIRLTGMPAWGSTGADDADSWKLVHFIRHLPQVTFEEQKDMEKLNPKGADEQAEEEAVEKFLRGEQVNETSAHHHH